MRYPWVLGGGQFITSQVPMTSSRGGGVVSYERGTLSSRKGGSVSYERGTSVLYDL